MRSPPTVTLGPLRALLGSAVISVGICLAAWLIGSPGAAQLPNVRFQALDPFAVSVGPNVGQQAFALADLNGDRNLDLVAIDQDGSVVNVYLGDGQGNFNFSGTFEAPDTPTVVAVADIGSPSGSAQNGAEDGYPDIIVGADGGELEFLLGHGDGTFEVSSQDPTDVLDTTNIAAIALGDFDKNGETDIAVADADDGSVFFICNSNGVFDVCATDNIDTTSQGDPIDMVVGDFDGDGKLDIAVLNRSDSPPIGEVSPIFGNGNGTFDDVTNTVAATEGDGLPTDFAAADMDGDGRTDLVIATDEKFSDITGLVLLGQPNGRFQSKPFSAPSSETDGVVLTLANFDADTAHTIDAIVAPAGETLSLMLGNGDGTFGSAFPAGGLGQVNSARALVSGAIKGDRFTDFIALSQDGTQMQVVLNVSGQVPSTSTPGTPPTPSATITGTAQPTSTPTPTVPTPTGTATNTPTPIPTANYSRCDVTVAGSLAGIATGLLDGDGTTDIAVTDPGNKAVWVLFNTANVQGQLRTCAMERNDPPLLSPPLSPTKIDVGTGPGAIAAIDVDRDGDVDLVVAENDGIVILRNGGQGNFTAEAPIPVGTNPVAIVADYPIDPRDPSRRVPLDLNNDGRTDLVIANAGSSFLSILYGRADGSFTVASRDIPGTADTVIAADFNQDGRVDLVAGLASSAVLLIQQPNLDNNRQSVFQSSTFGAGGPIVALSSGFFDSDRFPDLLITRGDTGLGQVNLFRGGSFVAAGEVDAGRGQVPTASGIGIFNASDSNAGVVLASQQTHNWLSFGLGDGTGAFKSPPLEPFVVGGPPVALSVAYIDGDGMQDVVTANGNGTISVLLSSVPAATPTPTATFTATATGTVTSTGTITDTPTFTPTATLIPSATPSVTPSWTRTPTPTGSATPKTPKQGAFTLSGGGCSIGDTPGRPPAEMVAPLMLLLVLRRRRRSRGTRDTRNEA